MKTTGQHPARWWMLIITGVILLYGCNDQNNRNADNPFTQFKNANILILFMDDFGHNDLAANHDPASLATPLHTPNLDQFVRQGIYFSRHYTESTCSPSRAALFSGRYPARSGFNPNGRGLPPEITTLPEALQKAGYHTHFVGKWHMGHTTPLALPHHQGFTTWFGFLNQWMLRKKYDPSVNQYYKPTYYNPWLMDETGHLQRYTGHLSDLITQNAINFINKQHHDQPWFLQVSFYAPHDPMEPANRYASLYPDTDEGKYRAMIHHLDDNIGRILEQLDKQNFSDNTIVVIASDNGGTTKYYPNNFPFFGKKTNYTEGGTRTPMMIRWPNETGSGIRYPHTVSIMDIYPTLLSAVGINYDEATLDGKNLTPVLSDQKKIIRPLFWEVFAIGTHFFSVLDENHQWRYSNDYQTGQSLWNMTTDTTGNHNVLNDYPEQVPELKADYRFWQEDIHHIDTHFQPISNDGKGILTGDSFQRSPGFGNYTLALGITPDTPSADEEQVIIYQDQLLELRYHREILNLKVQDASLSAPLPNDGQCHSIIISSRHANHISAFTNNVTMQSPILLIIDGKISNYTIDNRRLPKNADLTAPTYIGFVPSHVADLSDFNGKISTPLVYNAPAQINNSPDQPAVHSLLEKNCPQ